MTDLHGTAALSEFRRLPKMLFLWDWTRTFFCLSTLTYLFRQFDYYLLTSYAASTTGIVISSCVWLFRVVVSVLTVADTDCRLTEIGNVAQATGGHVCVSRNCASAQRSVAVVHPSQNTTLLTRYLQFWQISTKLPAVMHYGTETNY